jgi:hypothetical protein
MWTWWRTSRAGLRPRRRGLPRPQRRCFRPPVSPAGCLRKVTTAIRPSLLIADSGVEVVPAVVRARRVQNAKLWCAVWACPVVRSSWLAWAEKPGCAGWGRCALMTRMAHDLVHPPKARRGERIAVLSPSFAAAGAFPAVHEQAMRRLAGVTGLGPVGYPTTREVGASALERAADIKRRLRRPVDPRHRGGHRRGRSDHRHPAPGCGARAGGPKPFLGASDNTSLHHWLRANGIASFYGGSSQVPLGPGPRVGDVHARSPRAALITGETLQISGPGESEDVGVDGGDPRALTCFGDREPAGPWSWHGPARPVTGRTWGRPPGGERMDPHRRPVPLRAGRP